MRQNEERVVSAVLVVGKQGYTKENVVWSISSVNSFKQTLTEAEFSEKIKKIEWWNK